jgi:Zn-dependent protease
LIGWGKPTPVNPLRWRNKNLANVMVSGAGIMANLLIAISAFILFKVLMATGTLGLFDNGTLSEEMATPLRMFLIYSLIMNVSLAVFNLLPFPPLDGSKILQTFLPESMQPVLTTLEQYGFLILIVFLYMGLFGKIFAPILDLIIRLLML